jgi:hypothetical protein
MNKTMLRKLLKKRRVTEMREHGPTADDLNKDAAAVRDAMRAEQSRHHDAMSDNTWVCFCFETEDAKRETLAELGVQVDSKYVLGNKLRVRVGLKEEAGPQRANQPRKVGRWTGLV